MTIIIFGSVMAALGAMGLCGSVVLEVLYGEPLYILLSKVSAGVLGIGGIMVGVLAVKSRKR